MRIKAGRGASFAIITAVYILAALCGFLTYSAVSGYHWLRILIADVAATVLVFIFSCVFSNSSVYDPYWSVQPIVILGALYGATQPSLSKTLLMVMVALWGIRLTANWACTFHGLQHQDWRYTKLHDDTKRLYFLVNLTGIHLFPTLIVFACIVPAIFVMGENPQFSPICLIGFAVSIGAAILQAVADIQMQNYRHDRNTPFIEDGLWKYARHPNYLGEILMWWGVAIYAISLVGFRWYFILGAAANNLMFLFISIPLADDRQAKKEGYAQYCQGKNALLPVRLGKAN